MYRQSKFARPPKLQVCCLIRVVPAFRVFHTLEALKLCLLSKFINGFEGLYIELSTCAGSFLLKWSCGVSM